MRLVIVLVLLNGTLLSCAPARQAAPATSVAAGTAQIAGEQADSARRPDLREELLAMRAADQAVRGPVMAAFQSGSQPDSVVIANMLAVDGANLARLKEMVQAYGWPDRDMVGSDGVDAVWLLVQHAESDVAFQQEYLDWLERAFRAGELSPEASQNLALLTDRVRVNRGLPQLYGTQLEFTEDGRMIMKPIEDEASVDARRAALGLPPLAEYIALVRRMYGFPD